MRIAQIAPLSEAVPPKFYGGTERVVSWITEELVRQGHDVTLFASGDSETTAKLAACTPEGLRLLGYRDHTASHLAMLHHVRRRAHEFDILHFHIDLLQYPMFEDMNHKCVTTMHGRLDVPDFMPVYRTFTGMPLVSISDNQREPMPPAVNWASTIHHGLPAQNCPFYPEAKGGYLAFLGRISPEKRPDRAIEMAKRSGVPLKIAAKVDKADQEYWDEVIEPMIHHPLIEYIGEINEEQKKDFLGNALALAFPIDWPEPFGLVMIEAMSAGTPVIAFRNGSVPEVIADGVSGVLCDSMDEAVAAVDTVKTMSRAGVRRYFESQFTAECMVRKYVAVYEQLLAGQPDVIKLPTAAAFAPHYGEMNGSARPSLSAAAMPA
ncbi:glycosyltransferase family 4 protein [Methylobacterium oxalidis]|uniref:glycosyltransferase family 4 protein n=1 Tax=Methylobacterium oxalidis TaxID=944322 RepID=UPI003315CF77